MKMPLLSNRSTYLLLCWALLYPLNIHAGTLHDAIFKLLLSSDKHPYFIQPYSDTEQANLQKLYQLNQHQLLWFSSKHPVKSINQLLEIYANAPSQGLISSDYAEHYLKEQWQKIQQSNPDYYQFAAFDTALSLTFLRYLHDLHYGRVLPQSQGFRLPEKNDIKLASAIYDAIQIDAISKLAKDLEPQLKSYQLLKAALIKYKRLNLHFQQALHFELEESLHPGDSSSIVPKLQLYLYAVNTPITQPIKTHHSPGLEYSDDIVSKVQNLQAQHGLANDGVIGKQTLTILNTPFSQKVAQIELAMERLRWLPEQQHGPFILVNIPAFQLWVYDIAQSQSELLTMRVIVGKAKKRIRANEGESMKKALQTPIFTADLSYLVFSPYWNIPKNILKKEILPLLEKTPDYLQSHHMEIVSQFSQNTSVLAINEENISRLRTGQLHLRQRPGRRNALGHVKFIFPNNHAIYLHDTPARSLFNRSKRDFSHGCIRVEKPHALAEFVLQNQPGWDAKRIKRAMRANKTSIVDITQNIPVLIFYNTASANDAGVSFFADIYDHDNTLKAALVQRSELFATLHSPIVAGF